MSVNDNADLIASSFADYQATRHPTDTDEQAYFAGAKFVLDQFMGDVSDAEVIEVLSKLVDESIAYRLTRLAADVRDLVDS